MMGIEINWRDTADALARALRSRPCNCERKYVKGEALMRVTRQCSRCAELERYEAAVVTADSQECK